MITATTADVGRFVVYSDGALTPTVESGRISSIGTTGTVFVRFPQRSEMCAVQGCESSTLYWLDAFPVLLAASETYLASLSRGMREIESQGVRSAAFASRADETGAALRDLKAAVVAANGVHAP